MRYLGSLVDIWVEYNLQCFDVNFPWGLFACFGNIEDIGNGDESDQNTKIKKGMTLHDFLYITEKVSSLANKYRGHSIPTAQQLS